MSVTVLIADDHEVVRTGLATLLADSDIENVHRLRVSTRRAVAAIKLYRDWLPRKELRWMRKRLKKIRRAAGVARENY